MLPRFHATSFNWITWSGGTLILLGVQHNIVHISYMRNIIRKHAIGWEYGECLQCRPKPGYIAVMFLKNDREFWTHITKTEFNICFPEVKL